MTKHIEFVQPEGWAPPKGYSNGIIATGRTLYVAGQVGWNAKEQFESAEFDAQFAQALDNVLAVVKAAGGAPTDVVRMTIYVTDLKAYRNSLKSVGRIWKDRMGRHYPVMALVGVAGLVEVGALLEIEATACLAEVAT
ncbi:MAG: RidA family protein [Polyangiaceae bacterium]